MNSNYINWDKDTIYGYQKSANIILIDAIQEGIRQGDIMPPIDLIQLDKNSYAIAHWTMFNSKKNNHGGHHRAIGYKRENKSPPYILRKLSDKNLTKIENRLILLEDIQLINPFEIKDLKQSIIEQQIFWERVIKGKYPHINWNKFGIEKPDGWDSLISK